MERYHKQDDATDHKDQAITHRTVRTLTQEHVEGRQRNEQNGDLAEGFLNPFDTPGVQFHGGQS